MGLPIGQYATYQHPAVPARGSRPGARIIAHSPHHNPTTTIPQGHPRPQNYSRTSDCAPRMRGSVLIANGLAHRSTRDTPIRRSPHGDRGPARESSPTPRIIPPPQRQSRRDIPDRKTILVHQIARIVSRAGRRSPCGDRVMVGCCVFTYGQAHRLLRRCPASAAQSDLGGMWFCLWGGNIVNYGWY